MSRIIYQSKGPVFAGALGAKKGTMILATNTALLAISKTKTDLIGADSTSVQTGYTLPYAEIQSCRKIDVGINHSFAIETVQGKKVTLRQEDLKGLEAIFEQQAFPYYKTETEWKAGVVANPAESALVAAIEGKHISGLPIAEGVPCKITGNAEKYIFVNNLQEISLPMEKVLDVSIRTDVEIQKSYVSDVGGALVGAKYFGGLGAIIGGQAKEKTSKIYDYYLIFTYQKAEEPEPSFLVFQINDERSAKAIQALLNNFKASKHERIQIEL